MLQAFGDYLRDAVRSADLAARYGGDEFTVIMPRTPLSAAVRAASRLRRGFHLQGGGGRHVGTTLSIGVAELGQKDTPLLLLEHADKALYEAKRRGGNQVVIWPGGCAGERDAGETPADPGMPTQ